MVGGVRNIEDRRGQRVAGPWVPPAQKLPGGAGCERSQTPAGSRGGAA
jgi:hypothetical protein